MDKNEVRQMIKTRKKKLSEYEIHDRSSRIIERLNKSDIYNEAENVFIYVSYNQEVDTFILLEECLKDGKNVYAPRVTSRTEMEFYRILSRNDLVRGYMGIMEPGELCEKSGIYEGLFIMPGLAFDKDFHRIGYGGGFYDRYLARDNCFIKAALCFDFQLLESVPFEEYDLKPDIIVTENRLIRREQ